MRQEWKNLLFLHWDWEPRDVQRTLPEGLTVDTWNGRAYIGFVPFFMRRVRPAGFPAMPWLSDFLELNVRTYVKDRQGRPGVWFYSLDCNQPVAVQIARKVFHLPYFHADMWAEETQGGLDYSCRRRGREEARFQYRWEGVAARAGKGTMEEFLVERYRLFAKTPRGLLTGEVWHKPYGLMTAGVDGEVAPPLALAGFHPAGRPPSHAVFSEGVDVQIFSPSLVIES